jgi:DNA-binding response OmpR family regulator
VENSARILIVEDDMIIAAHISLHLTNLGYEVTGIESRGEEAIVHARLNRPDIILMDINLKGALDGIETVKAIRKNADISVVYLTANSDEATFSKARETHPEAFISKPFNKLNLQRTIALVIERNKDTRSNNTIAEADLKILADRIFVRHHGNMVKLLLKNILYI